MMIDDDVIMWIWPSLWTLERRHAMATFGEVWAMPCATTMRPCSIWDGAGDLGTPL